ncbi:MAG: SOS response-associated peptidase [Dehalococcoidia bacterium]|nr:SOS response-associated peptidase [Dehalococcoidia bacterium]
MCGRFTLTYRERQSLADELGVGVDDIPKDYVPRFNLPPTDPHFIMRLRFEDRQLLPAKWGLVNGWARDSKRAAAQINARAETLSRSSAFRDAFQKRRCAVPADGFFEWTGAGKERQPIWFHRPDGKLILFAGLYESWQPQPGQWQRTFTIITTAPNNLISPIHDRMPVILDEDAIDRWLDAKDEDTERLRKLLVPAPDTLLIPTPVSQRVNSVKNDDPACLEPPEAALQLL